MIDLKLIGYTVEHFETVLTPDVSNMDDNITHGMEIHCNSRGMEDSVTGLMQVVIDVIACNEGKTEPFARAGGTFNLLFEASEPADPEAINAALRDSGLGIALPLIRGLIAGATSLLSLPQVFGFPHVDPVDVQWEDYAETENE